jgi:hypothetical protein
VSGGEKRWEKRYQEPFFSPMGSGNGVRYPFLFNKRSRPYGSEPWVSKAVAQFGLENTIRNSGVPKRVPDSAPG